MILTFVIKELFSRIYELHHNETNQRIVYAPDNLGQLKFDEIFNSISSLRNSSKDEDLNAEYSKLPGMILRIAGVLTVLENV